MDIIDYIFKSATYDYAFGKHFLKNFKIMNECLLDTGSNSHTMNTCLLITDSSWYIMNN